MLHSGPAMSSITPHRTTASNTWPTNTEPAICRLKRHGDETRSPRHICLIGARVTAPERIMRAADLRAPAPPFRQTVHVGEIPETRYAKTDDGAHIAFQVLGDGPPDLVFVGGRGEPRRVGVGDPGL